MTDVSQAHHADPYVEEVRKAREAPAVLKLKLMSLRCTAPDVCVFAFEGVEDKVVYFHWIQRIDQDLVYEPFVCGGKEKLLQFMEMLDRDRSGLSRRVFFFVDRDFDDLRGRKPTESIFMTPTYSFENALVDEGVLDEVLKNELHCHAEPIIRQRALGIFRKRYEEFLAISRETNLRLFIARRCSIPLGGDLPTRINLIAEISLIKVEIGKASINEQVVLTREPTLEEVAKCQEEFVVLQPEGRYRGKFAYMFFNRLLSLLVQDRKSNPSTLFPELANDGYKALIPTLDSLAARSKLPEGLEAFIKVVGAHCQAKPSVSAIG